jgi:fructokinase
MKSSSKTLISFGEILWDLLPTGTQAGGAPMNVALRAQSLGMQTKIISKTGQDKMGKDILDFIAERGTGTLLIQQSKEWPTGVVNVELDDEGVATYDIVYPSAWDKIDLETKALEEVQKADAFVFGTLATRDEHSKTTLLQLLEKAPWKVFDINLRPPHYNISLIVDLAKKSNLLKLNDEELLILAHELGSTSEAIEENIHFLSRELHCTSICITKGAKGAVLFTEDQFYSHPGFKVKVADTVGAGDSFLATLVYHLLHNSPHQKAIEMACAMGSLVASKHGANSEVTDADFNILNIKP